MRVVVAGGGTAGHIEPALNTADALRALDAHMVVTALGTAKGLEGQLVPARGYELDLIPAVPLPRRVGGELLRVPHRLRSTVAATRRILAEREADVVVGFGGYVALPAYLAARGRVPIVVHEANAKAGLANRVGARFTDYVAETHAGSLHGAQVVGIPLRVSIAQLDRVATRTAAREFFGLDPDRPVIVVFGGSQGARRLNEAVIGAAPALVAGGFSVLHSRGGKNTDQGSDPSLAHVVTVDYISRMDLAYAAADVAVCRAGALTVAELSAVGLPAIFVPLPIGNGEQLRNALPVVSAGGGIVVPDAEFTADRMVAEALGLMVEPTRLLRMSAASAALGDRGAAQRLAQMTIAAAGG